MSTALTHANGNVAVMQHQPAGMSREQVELLKDTIAKGATDDELRLFVEVCRRKNLDPFSKQIHMVKRWDAQLKREVATFQIGIDGFRTLAERTGKFEGYGDTMWCGADGQWRDVWLEKNAPAAAKVSTYRAGFRNAITATALYSEYVQTNKEGQPNSMWRKMPANQLAKCAEALALRKAFPEELGGLYTNEEMGQADSEAPVKHLPQAPPPAAEVQPQAPPAEITRMWTRMRLLRKQNQKFGPLEVFGELKDHYQQEMGDESRYRYQLGLFGRAKSGEFNFADDDEFRQAMKCAAAMKWELMEHARLNPKPQEPAGEFTASDSDLPPALQGEAA